MAKVRNPFLSIEATGSFGKVMTANRGALGQIMRSMPLRKINGLTKAEISAGTPAQAARRALLTAAIVAWQALTPEEKTPYNTRAKPLQMSGYNLFLREHMATPAPVTGTVWDSGATVWDSSTTTWDA